MDSIWTKNMSAPRFDTLPEDKKTDVLIVGGGMAGILCAYQLKRAGVDCIVVEGDHIGAGVTQNTTAKITLSHGLLYDTLIKRFGVEKAGLYLQAQILAEQEYSRLCSTMDCDYETKDSYVYSLSDRAKIEREIRALNQLGVHACFSDVSALPIKAAGAVCVQDQAQFHPLKFLYAISKDLPIFENTKVRELKPHKAITNQGEIRFEKLVVATHFPILNKHGGYFLKLYQHRSYVLALKNAPNVQGVYVDEADTGLSFRNAGELLLLGGGGHRTGKTGGCWQELEDFAKKHYPKASVTEKWATQDCMSLDGMPYVGLYSKATPNVYVVSGFNKWGMTNAMAAACVLCDLIRGKSNPYASLFSPSRSVLHPQLFANAIESILGLLTPFTPRCPHLGCALQYNRWEHSWDCPCHGSRFALSGQLINNPATDDLKNRPRP